VTVSGIDHAAIPCRDPIALMEFYAALGFSVSPDDRWRDVQNPRLVVQCGEQKINLLAPSEWQDPEFTLRGQTATPGCGDLCFVWAGSVIDLQATIARAGAPIIEGPVGRHGGRGPGTSIYTRDPEGNLLEFIVY
jgi:catechol 2,3-dioxygenase-like lactoylglutathione lyase family enzyme